MVIGSQDKREPALIGACGRRQKGSPIHAFMFSSAKHSLTGLAKSGRRLMRAVMFGLLAAVVAACATAPSMTPQECASADWRGLGYADGVGGRSEAMFATRQQICLNAGYEANLDAYKAGHEEGARVFCQPGRAFQLGADGASAALACPADLEGPFRRAYHEGRELYDAKSAWESAESSLRSLFSEREGTLRKLNANLAGRDASKTPEERARHESEVLRLRNDLIGIDRRIEVCEREAHWRRLNYERVRWRLERPHY
jgi:hypothetical protein